jgi:hypothetical protein
MEGPCTVCKASKGLQRITEITRFNEIVIIKVAKFIADAEFDVPIKLNLDKFMGKNQSGGGSLEYEIVGCLAKDVCYFYNHMDRYWLQYSVKDCLYVGENCQYN